MHRETYVNRKIPLNALISVSIERVQNLKECLDNIEHFCKIQQSSAKDSDNIGPKSSKQSYYTGNSMRQGIM